MRISIEPSLGLLRGELRAERTMDEVWQSFASISIMISIRREH